MSISPSEKIKVTIEGNIATVIIDNPGANTWDRESLPALKQVVEALNEEPAVYALVLTGAGEKFFSAGADLNQFASGDADVARAVGDAFGEAFEALADFRGVSIAAINGFAMGGGLEVALACDIRIAEEQAALALPEARVGLLPCAGGTQRLTQLVGEGWAKRMILCGERIGAQQAQTLGLVEEVVPAGESCCDLVNELILMFIAKAQPTKSHQSRNRIGFQYACSRRHNESTRGINAVARQAFSSNVKPENIPDPTGNT